MEKSVFGNMFHTAWKSIVVGLIYVVLCMIAGMVLMSLGAKMPTSNVEMNQALLNFFLSGMLLSLFLGPLSKQFKLPVVKTLFIVLGVIFLNNASVVIEAAFFVSGVIPLDTLPSVLLQQFIISLGTAIMIALLFKSKEKQKTSDRLNWKWH